MSTSGSPLLDFLTQLSENPDLGAEFFNDPDGVLAASGLSPEAQDAVRSRDSATIVAVIESELGHSVGNLEVTFGPNTVSLETDG